MEEGIRKAIYEWESPSNINSQINNIKHFTKENPYNYIIDHPSEKNFDGKFFGIHFKSKYLYTLKSVPKDMILYSGSCHNFDEVEQANRLELDYILISPVQISKHSNQKIYAISFRIQRCWRKSKNIPTNSR